MLVLAVVGTARSAETLESTPTNSPVRGSSTVAPHAVVAPDWLTKPMTLVDAINVALQQNANILKGKSDLEAAYGVVVQTKAVALPKVRGSAGYTHDELVDLPAFPPTFVGAADVFPAVKDKWTGNLTIYQSVYEGGRINSSRRTARLTQEQALLQYQAVVADTLLEVRTAYFDVLLAEQQIIVQRASTNLLTKELEDTSRRFEAGTVPRFNVLRAEVELANALPKLIRAENAFVITKNNLANVLGYDVPPTIWEDIPLHLTDQLEAQPYDIVLPAALARALANRPELGALRKAEQLRQEDIVTARSGYKPSVQLFAGYGARNSSFSDDFLHDVAGANGGVQFNWDLWDGNLTKGKVQQAKALHEKARVELDDALRRVQLEVRTAYSFFQEARKVLDSQTKVLEQGEEALRLARSRYEAGTGTQLDVLNAQTSLTDARTTRVRALREYSVARARLQRAVGWDVEKEPADRLPVKK